MTAIEKERIRYLRGEGLGYKVIAFRLDLSVDAVKGFCRRSGLEGKAAPTVDDTCRQCGKSLERKTRAGQKKYCSDNCRALWWSRNADLTAPNEENQRVCVHCGCAFYSVPSKNRKYCGRDCYAAARFGGEQP